MNGENLREALRRHADDAPPGGGLLDAVKTRSRNRRHHRRLTVAGAAAVTVAVAITAPAVVRGIGDDPDRPPPPPAGQQTPTPPQVEPTGATTLVPAPEFELPDFPFTPTWIPSDLSEVQYDFADYNGDAEIDIDDELADERVFLYHAPSGEPAGIRAEVSDQNPEIILEKLEAMSDDFDEDEPGAETPQPLARQATTVQGREAVLLSNADQGIVAWRHEPGQWVLVEGRSADEVLRYAAGLAEEPFPAQTPFTFELLPDGAMLTQSRPGRMVFETTEFIPGSASNSVGVQLLSGPGEPGTADHCPLSYEDDGQEALIGGAECPLARVPVQVGEHAGELVGDRTVNVFLPDGLVLQVSAGGALSLSRDDLLRFVEGIEITEFAVPTSY